jgi:hypothetical protein
MSLLAVRCEARQSLQQDRVLLSKPPLPDAAPG